MQEFHASTVRQKHKLRQPMRVTPSNSPADTKPIPACSPASRRENRTLFGCFQSGEALASSSTTQPSISRSRFRCCCTVSYCRSESSKPKSDCTFQPLGRLVLHNISRSIGRSARRLRNRAPPNSASEIFSCISCCVHSSTRSFGDRKWNRNSKFSVPEFIGDKPAGIPEPSHIWDQCRPSWAGFVPTRDQPQQSPLRSVYRFQKCREPSSISR